MTKQKRKRRRRKPPTHDSGGSSSLEVRPTRVQALAHFLVQPIRDLIKEFGGTPSAKLNAATISVLAVMWVLITFALLAELKLKVKLDVRGWLRVETGGDPLPIGIVWAFLLLVWLGVMFLCSWLYRDNDSRADSEAK
jgi:hypothetical protein